LDLATQVEAYRERYRHYPGRVIADPILARAANRDYLKQRGIHFAGKAARPPQASDRRQSRTAQASPGGNADKTICNAFPSRQIGKAKMVYRLNYIRAKRLISFALDQHIFLVMNLLICKDLFWPQ